MWRNIVHCATYIVYPRMSCTWSNLRHKISSDQPFLASTLLQFFSPNPCLSTSMLEFLAAGFRLKLYRWGNLSAASRRLVSPPHPLTPCIKYRQKEMSHATLMHTQVTRKHICMQVQSSRILIISIRFHHVSHTPHKHEQERANTYNITKTNVPVVNFLSKVSLKSAVRKVTTVQAFDRCRLVLWPLFSLHWPSLRHL